MARIVMKFRIGIASAFTAIAMLSAVASAHAEAKKEFNIAWSIYVGWMPWLYAVDAGIVKK